MRAKKSIIIVFGIIALSSLCLFAWQWILSFDAEYKIDGFDYSSAYDGTYKPLSLVSVIAVPEDCDGNLLELTGVLNFSGQDYRMLYLDHKSYQLKIMKNGINLHFPQEIPEENRRSLSRLDGYYVVVYGRMINSTGPMNFYSGEMVDISYIRRKVD